MDRSFLAFRQFLVRLVAGPVAPKADAGTIRHPPRDPRSDVKDDWARIEL